MMYSGFSHGGLKNRRGWVALLTLAMVAFVIWATSNDIPQEPPLVVSQVSVPEAVKLIQAVHLVILDVRERDAYNEGHLPNAISVPIGELDSRMQEFEAEKENSMLIYCNEGSSRGPRATDMLNRNGYSKAANLDGGLEAWEKAGMAIAK